MRILFKEIDIENSPILFNENFAEEGLDKNWRIYGGKWFVEDGWLTGKNPDNGPGVIIAREDFPGDIMLDFEARSLLPSTHDIDFFWNGSWDVDKNQRGISYVGALQGWWEGKVGFEKAPDNGLVAISPLFSFEPDRTYHIQAGSIGGHCFIFADGKLLIELIDPNPIDSALNAKIGFEAYCSQFQVRNLTVRRINWKPVELKYVPEFK